MEKKFFMAVHIMAGIMLIVFGSNKFFGFIELQHSTISMSAFLAALSHSGYLMELVAIVEILAGIAFLLNKYVALMAVVLMPVMLNAFLAHLFLDPSAMAGASILLLFNVLIMIESRARYKQLLKP